MTAGLLDGPAGESAMTEAVSRDVERRDLRVADLAFAGMVAVALALRAHYLIADGAPIGVDGGNWLSYGRALLGASVRPEGAVYPPAVPLLVTAAVTLFGLTAGVVLIGAISAVVPGVAVYALLRREAGASAPLLAGMLLLSPSAGAMASWGGYPQLIGSGIAIAGLWGLAGWLQVGNHRALVLTTASAGLLLAGSHAAAAVGLAAATALGVVALVRGGGEAARRLLIAAVGSTVVGLPLLSVYIGIGTALVGAQAAEPGMTAVSLAELPEQFSSVHLGAWPVWAAGYLLAGVALLNDRARTRLGLVTAALWLGLPALLLLTAQPRVLYEAPVVSVLGLALLTTQSRAAEKGWIRTVQLGTAAVALVLVASTGTLVAAQQRASYAVLDTDLVAAVDWVRRQTPPGATIAVPASGDAPLGWWVEGLAHRRVLAAAPLRWLNFPAERERAHAANDLFHRLGMPTREGMHRAADLDVDYVLLPKNGLRYRFRRGEHWRDHVVFDNAGVVVLEVEGHS